MKLLESRRQFVFGIALIIFIGALIYGAVLKTEPDFIKYRGLTLQSDIQMEDDVRTILEQRIATTQASIKAQSGNEDMDTNLYLLLAGDANLLGDLVLERETYEAYFEMNNINYMVWNNYANVLQQMGDNEKAEEAYRKAIELNPNEEYYRDLIDHIRKTSNDREDEVLEILKEGVAEEGQTTWFMVMMAQWYMADGDCEQALAHYRVAETLSPGNEGLINEIAEAKVTCK